MENEQKIQYIKPNSTENVKNPSKIVQNVEKTEKNVEKNIKIQTKNEQKNTFNEFSSIQEQKNQNQIVKKVNKKIISTIENIKKIRIDNTLAHFSKKEVRNIKPSLELLNDLLLDPDYSNSASMLLDGILKAASEENLIFVYKTKRLADLFNENLLDLEETIAKILNKKYNLIATYLDEWETIKKELNCLV